MSGMRYVMPEAYQVTFEQNFKIKACLLCQILLQSAPGIRNISLKNISNLLIVPFLGASVKGLGFTVLYTLTSDWVTWP